MAIWRQLDLTTCPLSISAPRNIFGWKVIGFVNKAHLYRYDENSIYVIRVKFSKGEWLKRFHTTLMLSAVFHIMILSIWLRNLNFFVSFLRCAPRLKIVNNNIEWHLFSVQYRQRGRQWIKIKESLYLLAENTASSPWDAKIYVFQGFRDWPMF